MKTRYTINAAGELVDRAGNVLGRLTSLTIDVGQGGTIGGVGGPSQEQRPLTRKAPERTEGGAGETVFDAEVVEVWRHWIERRQPRFTALEPSQARLIRKGINAVGLEGLKAAIDGLLASDWHREHKQVQLSTVLKTRPGGATLRDQIESFMERSPSPAQEASERELAEGRLRSLKAELAKYDELPDDALRPGDVTRRDELRALIAEAAL